MEGLEIGLCWGSLQRANLVELIEAAGRHGFPTLSVRPFQILEAIDQGLDEKALRKRLADAGVRVTVIDALGQGLPGLPVDTSDAVLTAVGRADLAICLRVAEAVGAPMINVSHYKGEPVPLPQLAEGIGGICREAAKRGVTIVLEFTPDGGMPNLGAALELTRTCGEPNCAILLDTWHLARSGGTTQDILALPPKAIGAFQLSDRNPPAPGAVYVPMTGRDLPGEGQLPLCDQARAVLANSPGISAELEVFSAELRGLSVADAVARIAKATEAWRSSCAR